MDAVHRELAPAINRILRESIDFALTHSVEETERFVAGTINSTGDLETEYYQIVDSLTMQPVDPSARPCKGMVGCVTVYCGGVRLIDNIKY